MTTPAFLPLLLALQVQAPLAVRPDTLQTRHDALHYDIALALSDSDTRFMAQVTTLWKLASERPVRLELDSAFQILGVQVGGKPGQWSRDAGGVTVPIFGKPGDTISTNIIYVGSTSDGLVFHKNAYGARTIFADNWPDRAHHWLASQDHPSDKATADYHIKIFGGGQVLANGTLVRVDTVPDNTIWHYRIAEPIPVYTMVVAVGKFSTTRLPDAACAIKCVPMSVVTYPQDSAFAVDGPFKRAGEIVDFFSRTVGPFPYERLSHVESTTIFGGMENSTAIFYDEKNYEKRTLGEGTVAHETAHQWFGDAVTERDWHHLWLSEGFASYFAVLWAEHVGGVPARAAGMQKYAEAVIASPVTERPIIDPPATDLMKFLNTNNYPKGAWTLHSLRGLMGDSAFFKGIREYYRIYRDSTALSSDFANVMSKAAGRDLDWYFLQALTQPGYPVLDVKWSYATGKLTVDVKQTQKPAWGSYRIPNLMLQVDGHPMTLDVNGPTTHMVFDHVAAAPKSVIVDPDGWWLLQSTVHQTP